MIVRKLRATYRAALRLAHDRRGSLLTTFALAAPVLFGIVGLGVESGQWYANKRALQTQADAAALSGAFERAKGRPENVTAAALREATRNGFSDVAPNNSTVNNPPAAGSLAGEPEAVEVILQRQQELLLSSFISDSMKISARAVAAVQTTGTACVLALDPTMASALTNTGNPDVNMAGCVMAANSTNASAINITGSATVTAESLWTAGGYYHGGSATVTLNTPAQTHAWPIDDPYASLTIPPLPGSCDAAHTSLSINNTRTINPGVYCDGMSIQSKAVLTLNPGTYFIDGGNLQIQGGAVVRCNCLNLNDGVTFVLTSSVSPANIGSADIRGGSDIQLRAPKTGSYAGVIFYQDRRATGTTPNKFNGDAGMQLLGAIYAPAQIVQYSGNNGTTGANCTQIVSRQVVFIGNAKINNVGCPAAGVEPLKIVGVKVME